MSDHFVFISYSRRQLYFAESLALHLQSAGLGVWFDLQQLNPGEDWQAEIQRGLDDYTALVLIASQSGLASPYVRVEWEEALREGRPVIVCAYSAITLPPELVHCPLIDFRGDFDSALQRLIAALRSEDKPQDRIPAPNRFGFQTRMPRSIWLMIITLFFGGVLLPLLIFAGVVFMLVDSDVRDQMLITPQFTLFLWISLLAVAAYLPVQFVGFLRHRTPVAPLRVVMVANVVGLGVLFVALFLSMPAALKVASLVLIVVFTPLTIYAFAYLLRSSPALLRWQPLNASTSPAWRSRINAPLVAGIGKQENIVQTITPSAQPMTQGYQLFCMPEDNPIAARMTRAMQVAGHHYAADSTQATLFFAVVTNATQTAWLNALIDQFQDRLICLIASPIQVDEGIKRLSQYQYIDCRVRQNQRFAVLAASLRGDVQSALYYSLNVIPADVGRLQTPTGIALYAHILRASAALAIASALGYLLISLGLVNRGAAAIWAVPIFLGLGIAQFLISSWVLRRETTIWIALGAAAALSLLGAGVTVLAEGQLTSLVSAVSDQINVIIFTIILFFWSAYQWLPTRLPPRETGGLDRLTKNFQRRLWTINGAYVIIYFILFGVALTVPPQTPNTTTGEARPPLTEPLYYAGSESFSSLINSRTPTFIADADAFVAAFPDEPTISERRYGSGARIREYQVSSDAGEFLVRVVDFSGVNDVRDNDARLDFFLAIANNPLPDGTLQASESFTVGSIVGRTYTFTSASETLRGLVAISGDKVYLVSVLSPLEQADDLSIETFLASFALFASSQ